MGLIGSLIVAVFVGAIVYVVGTFFDKTPNNQWAGLAGLLAFVLTFFSTYGRIDL